MALLFCDSFDHYATGDLVRKWGTVITGSLGSSTIGAAAARTGSNGLVGSWNISATSSYPIVTVAPTTSAAGVCGMAMRFTAYPSGANTRLFAILDQTAQENLWVNINTDGTLNLRATGLLGTTTATLALNIWHFVELKFTIGNSPNGSAELRLNGAAVLTVSGVDTQATTSTTFRGLQIGPWQGGTGALTMHYDDVYLCDQSGSNADFLGDIQVNAHLPNANGAFSQWTRSTGTDQYATIDDMPSPNDDTDYNESITSGHLDTVSVANLANPGAEIRAIQHCFIARKVDTGTAAISPAVRHGTTNYLGTGVGLPIGYQTFRACYDSNPGTSAAWTETEFNAAEYGYQRV
jgi:hypothetical protein